MKETVIAYDGISIMVTPQNSINHIALPVMPSIDAIKQGSYPFFRELYNYTRDEPQGLVKAYFDFALSPEGQQIVSRIGYIPVR